ncbi:Uncharacterized protein dnm_034500 [Desulfonema magnum]|uniref:Uncharacterized protein n=1 Tax=Desulfonema magnum TaxID=45655 RepID=A0A975GN58_9BACT|nr:Uncharacterized protein dnm_034500 [Desulfonema magnum]
MYFERYYVITYCLLKNIWIIQVTYPNNQQTKLKQAFTFFFAKELLFVITVDFRIEIITVISGKQFDIFN